MPWTSLIICQISHRSHMVSFVFIEQAQHQYGQLTEKIRHILIYNDLWIQNVYQFFLFYTYIAIHSSLYIFLHLTIILCKNEIARPCRCTGLRLVLIMLLIKHFIASVEMMICMKQFTIDLASVGRTASLEGKFTDVWSTTDGWLPSTWRKQYQCDARAPKYCAPWGPTPNKMTWCPCCHIPYSSK